MEAQNARCCCFVLEAAIHLAQFQAIQGARRPPLSTTPYLKLSVTGIHNKMTKKRPAFPDEG